MLQVFEHQNSEFLDSFLKIQLQAMYFLCASINGSKQFFAIIYKVLLVLDITQGLCELHMHVTGNK